MKKYLCTILLLAITIPFMTVRAEALKCDLFPWKTKECQEAIQLEKDLVQIKTDNEADLVSPVDEVREKAEQAVSSIEKNLTNARMEIMSSASSKFNVTKAFQVGGEGTLSLLKLNDDATDDRWILAKVIKLMTQIIGTFAILVLAIGGVLMITSQGDENRLQKGKNIVFYTAIGLIVAFASYIGVQFIISVLFTTTG